MRKTFPISCIIILVSLFVGCSSAPKTKKAASKDVQPVPGVTKADLVLQADIRKAIGHCEHYNGGSLTPKIIDTKSVKINNAFVESLRGKYKDELVEEVWIVERNGIIVEHEVAIFPNGQGGSFIWTSPECFKKKK